MIKVIKENETKWMVWNKKTGEIADIVRIFEGGYLASKNAKYRVDYKGKTVDTMIVGWTRAKSVAMKLVK